MRHSHVARLLRLWVFSATRFFAHDDTTIHSVVSAVGQLSENSNRVEVRTISRALLNPVNSTTMVGIESTCGATNAKVSIWENCTDLV